MAKVPTRRLQFHLINAPVSSRKYPSANSSSCAIDASRPAEQPKPGIVLLKHYNAFLTSPLSVVARRPGRPPKPSVICLVKHIPLVRHTDVRAQWRGVVYEVRLGPLPR